MSADKELDAIRQVADALEGLDLLTCDRILRWARERFVESTSTAVLDEFGKTMAAMTAEAKARGLRPGELERAVAVIAEQALSARSAGDGEKEARK
jgi:hypothetical protein